MMRRLRDVDQGYSWVVLIFCGINYLIYSGSVKSFGVLYTELLDYYEAGAGSTAWISSVNLLLFFSLAPVSNFLGERYSYRVVMMIGSIFILIGYTASAYVPNMELLYLTYGVIAGVGYGLLCTPSSTIINFYFDKRRGLANGLMTSVGSIGNLGFPFMYRALIGSYGLHGALLISGAIYFHTFAASVFLRQPQQLERKQIEFSCEAITRMFKFDLFRNPKFTVLLLALDLQVGSYACYLVAIPGQVRSLNLDKITIALAMSLIGASEIVARVFLGWFADLNIIPKPRIFMMCSGVGATIGFVIPHLPYKEAIFVFSVLMGASSGSAGSLNGVLMVDAVGLDNISPATGLISVTTAIPVFVGQPITGWLDDATGNWDMSFRFAGLSSALSFLIYLCEPRFIKWCKTNKEMDPIVIETVPLNELLPENGNAVIA